MVHSTEQNSSDSELKRSGVARNLRDWCVIAFLYRFSAFLDPNTRNCRWPSISFPAVSYFGDCSHAYRSCDLRKTLWFEKRKTSTAQAHDAICLIISLTNDRQVLRVNHWEIMCKSIVYFSHGECVRTLYVYATAETWQTETSQLSVRLK